jgi:hypothetical protein
MRVCLKVETTQRQRELGQRVLGQWELRQEEINGGGAASRDTMLEYSLLYKNSMYCISGEKK